MEELYFKVLMDDGSDQLCKVVFTFDSDDLSYVLYSTVDDAGNESEEISALRYELDEDGKMTNFTPLETEEEWDMVEEVLNTLVAEFGDGEEDYFTIFDEDGEEIECEVLHRFELKDFNKSYILYTYAEQDGSVGEIFAAAYVPGDNGEIEELLPIDSDEEWEKIEKELEFINQ